MGTLTYAQLTAELRGALGGNRTQLESRLVVFLNLAQDRIARRHNWVELQRLQTGTLSFTGDPTVDKFMALPTNYRSLYSFRLTPTTTQAPRKLFEIQSGQWDEKIPEAEYYDVGYPSHYTVWYDRFEFWKIPDFAYPYAIRYSIWPTSFTGSDDLQTSDLKRKDDAIIALAVSWAFLTLRETEEANRWWAVYKDMINDATGLDTEKPSLGIKPAFESGFSGSVGGDYWRDPFVNGG